MSAAAASAAATMPKLIAVRVLDDSDRDRLEHLAGLDSARLPARAAMLGAEVDGRLIAAISLRDGSLVADPFVPTAAAVELLRIRSAQLRGDRRRRRLRIPRLPRARGAIAGSPPGGGSHLLQL